MGLIETAKRFFCLEKCMILVSVDGFLQFLPKLVEEKVSSRTEKNGKNHGKNHPLEHTANPGIQTVSLFSRQSSSSLFQGFGESSW